MRAFPSQLQLHFLSLILFGGLVFNPASAVNAQEVDVEMLILRSTINCHDIAFGATRLIQQHHAINASDTLPALMAYWEERCGMPEPLMRYMVLRNIQLGTFNENQLPARVLNYLYDYRDAVETSAEQFANYYFDFEAWDYVAMYPGYNGFTAALAGILNKLPSLQPVEFFFVHYYSNEFEQAMDMLAGGELEGSLLDSLYLLRERPMRLQRSSGLWPAAPVSERPLC